MAAQAVASSPAVSQASAAGHRSRLACSSHGSGRLHSSQIGSGTGRASSKGFRRCAGRRAAGARLLLVARAAGGAKRATVTERAAQLPPPEVEVKIFGLGSRGASAIAKLLASGKVPSADLWCLDVDKKALDAAPTSSTVLLPKEDPSGANGSMGAGPLAAEEVQRIIGRAAADANGRGNIGAAVDGAVTFVIAPAAAVPGGAAAVLQLVHALRAAGHFTVAAVTRPFEFEGALKQEQATRLIDALEESAHLVAVMEQDVLMQAFGDSQMTVAEATGIADTALEHTVRCILQAVKAQEILKSSRGALMWHGRDLRHYKRLLSPPLQQLLTCPGTAVLGRGLASLPVVVAHEMGAAQALMHLASDAVRAAAESPFLDAALENASAVLCALTLPPTAQQFVAAPGAIPTPVLAAMLTPEGERHATRMAAQAAAGALSSLTGPGCQDFVMCAEPRGMDEPGSSSNDGAVYVEATLLLLRKPGTGRPAPGAAASAPRQYAAGLASPLPAEPQPVAAAQPQQQLQPPQGRRLPASSWNMLSALAGGGSARGGKQAGEQQGSQPANQAASQPAPSPPQAAAPAPPTQPAPAPAPPPQQQQQQQARAPPAVRSPFQGTVPSNGSLPVADSQPLQQQQQQPPLGRVPVQRPERLQQQQQQAEGQVQAGAAPVAKPVEQKQHAAVVEAATKAEQQAQPRQPQQPQRVTVGEYLVESVSAQSLDLPPAAARWRQQQRLDMAGPRKLIVWEVDEVEPWEEEEEEPLLAALLPGRRKERRVNLRERMAGILAQDREEAREMDGSSVDEEDDS